MNRDLLATPLAGRTLAPAGADLVIAEVTDPGGGSDPPAYIAPLHVHEADDEAWYVLEGALGFRVGEDEVELRGGGAIVVPRGTVHTFWNASPGPTRYLLVMTATIHRLVEALHQAGSGDMEAVFEAHASRLIGWPER